MTEEQSYNSTKKLSPYEFWNKIGCPKTIVAPMVDHCDLAYRMQCRKYGAQLVYTQMYNANAFIGSKEIREENFTTCALDRPLIVQFAGHDPSMLLQAALLVEECCDAVDLNLGCPQGIAKRGRYGAFLMDELDLLSDIVSTMVNGLKIPVTCKIRIYKDFNKNIKLCETLINAGASLLTIHGRTRDEKGQYVAEADWDMIKRIKVYLHDHNMIIPIIANGGIESIDDVNECIKITNVDGVMSSEAILENPSLFTNNIDLTTNSYQTQLQLAVEYLSFCKLYPVWHMKCVRSHILKMLYRYICIHTEYREKLALSHSIEDYLNVCKQISNCIHNSSRVDKDYICTWYMRYRQSIETSDDGINKVISKATLVAREKFVNLTTSFLNSNEDIWNNSKDIYDNTNNNDIINDSNDINDESYSIFDILYNSN